MEVHRGLKETEQAEDEKEQAGNEKERWVPIPEHEGYSISTYGKIISHKRARKIELRQISNGSNETVRVCLCNEGKKQIVGVGRLVLKTFADVEGSDSMVAYHKDGDITNNKLSNLEWRNKADCEFWKDWVDSKSRKRMRPVQCVETGEVYRSIKEAAEANNTAASSIGGVLRGERHKAGGYTWKYVAREG